MVSETKHQSSSEPGVWSVTQLLRRMKNLMEIHVGEVWIEGEVSNLRRQPSGHWYFSLKDQGAQISCAMFGARKRLGSEMIEDGAKVRIFAEASVYEARGQLQVIVSKVKSVGAGELQAKLEALKSKLQAEGLFDADRKQAIPKYPETIGLITSASGAALQDMLNVLSRRASWVQPVLMPVRVQGKGAENEIVTAIERMGQPTKYNLPTCDLLIVGRGGGSLEDLWNFNEEVVARAISACSIPIISAVGHEVDFTIADFVADLRAPTPSAAIELAVIDGDELKNELGHQCVRLARRVQDRLTHMNLMLEGLSRGSLREGDKLLREPTLRIDAANASMDRQLTANLKLLESRLMRIGQMHQAQHPRKVLNRRVEKLNALHARIGRATEDSLVSRRHKLEREHDLLRALGPESAFQRGFSITMDQRGRIVSSVDALIPGQRIISKFADGEVRSDIVEK